MTMKREGKRSRILDVAAGLFSERGYAATRMQDIADGVDMQAGSLYYYFDSKESVLASIVGERVGLAVTMLEGIVTGPGGPIDHIRAGIEGHIDVFDRHADLYRIFISERLDAISEALAAQVDELGRRYEHLWTDLIRQAQREGVVRAENDPWLLMKAIVGMCNSTLFWFEPAGRHSSSDVARVFAEIVLAGIAAD